MLDDADLVEGLPILLGYDGCDKERNIHMEVLKSLAYQEVGKNRFFQLTPEGQHALMAENVSKLTPGYTFCDINICGSKVCHLFFVA